ncbi:hypothetical protein BGX31_006371 [Mortierella sp. GBA43]|nr:hypothetical protein BGX31_006371 [Mortierella sp. GBA43]
MIPTKRSSPFTRARTFHGNQARKEQGEDADMEGSPFKRPSFARTLSTPFQVLNPSLKNIRNPFEKLALGPRTEDSQSGSALNHASQDIREEGFESTSTLSKAGIPREDSSDDDDDDLEEEQDPDPVKTEASESKPPLSQISSKSRLQEALKMSAKQGIYDDQELLDVDQRAIGLDFENIHLDNITRKPIMV